MTDTHEAVLFRHKVDGREFVATDTSIPSIKFLDAQEEYERVESEPAAKESSGKRASKAPAKSEEKS
ncbi:hypothetical protein [Streptomyces spiralis]